MQGGTSMRMKVFLNNRYVIHSSIVIQTVQKLSPVLLNRNTILSLSFINMLIYCNTPPSLKSSRRLISLSFKHKVRNVNFQNNHFVISLFSSLINRNLSGGINVRF